MYTQQSNALAAALALPAGQQQSQALLQVFANCIQGLRQNGPVSINTGAGSQAPPGGVINSPPGVGSVTNNYYDGNTNNTTNNLQNYLNGGDYRTINNYPPNVWNVNNYGGDTNNSYFTTNNDNTSNFFGGDTFYGDNYQTTNNYDNSQNFNINNQTDYNTYNNSTNNVNNSIQNNNVSNWYNNQYTDNSYNDFSTTLQTTQNSYNQTVNNFEGDSYFENTVNQGDVINQSTVINQGDVIHQGDTYLDENKTFITNDNRTINLINYITNTVINIIQGGGQDGKDGKDGLPAKPLPHTHAFKGKKTKIKVPKYKFNAESCAIEEDGTKDIEFTPQGTVEKNAP